MKKKERKARKKRETNNIKKWTQCTVRFAKWLVFHGWPLIDREKRAVAISRSAATASFPFFWFLVVAAMILDDTGSFFIRPWNRPRSMITNAGPSGESIVRCFRVQHEQPMASRRIIEKDLTLLSEEKERGIKVKKNVHGTLGLDLMHFRRIGQSEHWLAAKSRRVDAFGGGLVTRRQLRDDHQRCRRDICMTPTTTLNSMNSSSLALLPPGAPDQLIAFVDALVLPVQGSRCCFASPSRPRPHYSYATSVMEESLLTVSVNCSNNALVICNQRCRKWAGVAHRCARGMFWPFFYFHVCNRVAR